MNGIAGVAVATPASVEKSEGGIGKERLRKSPIQTRTFARRFFNVCLMQSGKHAKKVVKPVMPTWRKTGV